MNEVLKKVPVKSNIKVKEQDKGFMVFNLETSGFHLLQKDAIDVLDKTDGVKTIAQIAEAMSKDKNEPLKDVEQQLAGFFTELEKRKIVRWKQ